MNWKRKVRNTDLLVILALLGWLLSGYLFLMNQRLVSQINTMIHYQLARHP